MQENSCAPPKIKTKQEKALELRRSAVFQGTRLLSFAVLVACCIIAILYFNFFKYLIRHSPLVLAWFSLQLFWNAATGIATQVCRSQNLSLDGTEVDTIARSSVSSQIADHSGEAIGEPVVLRRGGGAYLVPILATLMCVLCFSPALFGHVKSWEEWGNQLLAAILLAVLAATAILSWKNVFKPELQADENGVTNCSEFGVTSQFIKWTDIHACELISKKNVFGEVVTKTLQLNDHKSRKLFLKIITPRKGKDIDRFVNYVALRLTGEKHLVEIPEEAPLPPKVKSDPDADIPLTISFGTDKVEVRTALYFRLFVCGCMATASYLFWGWNEKADSFYGRMIVDSVPWIMIVVTIPLIVLINTTCVRIRADASGFMQREGFLSGERKILWQQIASADYIIEKDNLGGIARRVLILKDHDGATLTSSTLVRLTKTESAKLLEFIKERIGSGSVL